MPSRPAPRDLRASDADRERVTALLGEAAADGRLTLGEHSERIERAWSARTLGELAELTADLAAPSAQPIQLDNRRAVTGIFGQGRREGRWVMPDRLAASAIFGEVTLDLREALLQSRRVTVLATVICGTLKLIVPDEVAVEVAGAAVLGRTGSGVARAGGAAKPGAPVIEVKAFAVAGRVKIIRPRRPRPRWPRLRRPGQQVPR
jgi:Domain of unknown function (DUF1707)/Cell wall-active antibiotics response 4TMS YvqF